MSSDKSINHLIDWLQFTVEWPNVISEWPINLDAEMALARTCVPRLPNGLSDWSRPDGEHIVGMSGYSKSYDLGYASVHVNPLRRSQKIGVRMTGQDLAAYRDLGGTDARLIEFLIGVKASVSRIDVAFDLHNYNVNVLRINQDWLSGKVVARCKTVQPVSKSTRNVDGSITTASTLYFGSRTSETMIRIYEKGKQLGTNEDWVRIEMELKGDIAKSLVNDMSRLGIADVGKQVLRNYFSVMPYKFWSQLLNGTSVELTKVPRKLTDRQAWLLNVVMPVLLEEMQNEWDDMSEPIITNEIDRINQARRTNLSQSIIKQYAWG